MLEYGSVKVTTPLGVAASGMTMLQKVYSHGLCSVTSSRLCGLDFSDSPSSVSVFNDREPLF